ncbi:zinc-binding alcohol dehydrogenase family protein [Actinoplanes sp. Pm04-4]|uniref:alcohol dehydrogenase n=1 Tax=Paractinoplanes pyxinae TaxID=2997416 RepID=A0ABT4B945_9ACTN|nr:zinc-binding alcohol dehydrogenase family protein [Actinoplanes pyxinae]MCY1143029.1 zinc-binding alcohol dehydrogenase family protein [Actinoplanes pyxinae]
MLGWQVTNPGADVRRAVSRVEMATPRPGAGELLVAVDACGVCRTDLHVASGELPVHRRSVVPGHEVVGHVAEVGADVTGWRAGDRVGVAWLRETDGTCHFCTRGNENLCPASRYTGWDADGGYAEFTTVRADFAYALPSGYTDAELAPLLCAGIIGFRALRLSDLPPGGRLGIYGFGGSAHLTAQVAIAQGAEVHVLTRSPRAQQLALDLGAASARDAGEGPPVPLDSAIIFAPVGTLVPTALRALDRGGTLAIAGIYLTDIPSLRYEEELFQERTVRSVTANTRQDGRDLLDFAEHHRLEVAVTPYAWENADAALIDLAEGRVRGAAVLGTFDPAEGP